MSRLFRDSFRRKQLTWLAATNSRPVFLVERSSRSTQHEVQPYYVGGVNDDPIPR